MTPLKLHLMLSLTLPSLRPPLPSPSSSHSYNYTTWTCDHLAVFATARYLQPSMNVVQAFQCLWSSDNYLLVEVSAAGTRKVAKEEVGVLKV